MGWHVSSELRGAAAALLWLPLAASAAASARTPVVWTIAGSDSGGGAGIQADLHAIKALGAHGCSVITALTAQNSHEVRRVEYCSVDMLRETIAVLADDLPANAVKLGMLGSEVVLAEVAAFLRQYNGVVVCDPVLISSSGSRLLAEGAIDALRRDIFPHCALITPNLSEAETLVGRKVAKPPYQH